MSRLTRRIAAAAVACAVAVVGVAATGGVSATAAVSHAEITGSGSSWAANALNQWIADVSKQGLQVVFTSTGSAQGRKDFGYGTTDFGVSDIPYQGKDPITGQPDNSNGRLYAYLPIVAGGTSFPYHLLSQGKMIRNLRLSGLTLAKIFTNQITMWNDPEIEADNNNKLVLPAIPIIPVVHSEGSGSTAQFTAYLANQFPSIWGPFNNGVNASTEYFPRAGRQIAQNGSDGVMNFITSGAGNGTIGFDEYSYALLANYPVANVENKAGYFTAPTQYNVAVALTQAVINQDPSSPLYLTQDLDPVYVYTDPRTYPLSSYSYMIIPTGTNATEKKTTTTAQRQTIADFLYYDICEGQAEVGPIGYSPLPLFLVQDGFGQIAKLKAADPGVDLTNRNVTTCNNPTFDAATGDLTNNHLAKIAPEPLPCQKVGAGPCGTDVGPVNVISTGPSTGASGGSTSGATNPTAGTNPSSGTGLGGGGGGAVTINPITGQTETAGPGVSDNEPGVPGDTEADQGDPPISSALIASTTKNSGFSVVLYIMAIILILGIIVLPVTVGLYVSRREQ